MPGAEAHFWEQGYFTWYRVRVETVGALSRTDDPPLPALRLRIHSRYVSSAIAPNQERSCPPVFLSPLSANNALVRLVIPQLPSPILCAPTRVRTFSCQPPYRTHPLRCYNNSSASRQISADKPAASQTCPSARLTLQSRLFSCEWPVSLLPDRRNEPCRP